MLAIFALCFTGLSAQESEVDGQNNEGQEVSVESNVDTTDVAKGNEVEGNVEANVDGTDAEGSN